MKKPDAADTARFVKCHDDLVKWNLLTWITVTLFINMLNSYHALFSLSLICTISGSYMLYITSNWRQSLQRIGVKTKPYGSIACAIAAATSGLLSPLYAILELQIEKYRSPIIYSMILLYAISLAITARGIISLDNGKLHLRRARIYERFLLYICIPTLTLLTVSAGLGKVVLPDIPALKNMILLSENMLYLLHFIGLGLPLMLLLPFFDPGHLYFSITGCRLNRHASTTLKTIGFRNLRLQHRAAAENRKQNQKDINGE